MKRITNITIVLTILLSLVSVSIAYAGSELIWQIGTFDNSRAELKGNGLTGIHEFDFYVGTHTASDFPGTLYFSIPSPYDYRGVHKVNINFTLDSPYLDVELIYGRGGDETDEITLDLDGTPIATITGIENSWEGSPYTIPIGELAQGDHVISIEVTDGGILDDAHVVDALKLTGIPVSSYDLIAGQHDDVGDIQVWDDGPNLYIKYITDGLCLKETHLEAASDLMGIPQTKKGNPIPGQFSEVRENPGCVTESEIFVFSLDNTCMYIAAHAALGEIESMTIHSDGDGNTLIMTGNVPDVIYPYPAVDTWEAFNDPPDTGPSYWDSMLTLNGSPFSFSMGDWIWEAYRVVDPTTTQYVTFEQTFTVPGFPLSAKLYIATDNTYSASLNSVLVGEHTDWQNWYLVGEYDIFPNEGSNTLTVIGSNYGDPSYNLDNNPAGLIFEAMIDYLVKGDSAWAVQTRDPLGFQFDGKNWGTYFTYGTCP